MHIGFNNHSNAVIDLIIMILQLLINTIVQCVTVYIKFAIIILFINEF